MTEKRLTSRDLAQQRTRATLLATAVRLVAEKGFGGVSVGEIASAAGFTKGAFYSNFDSREAMFLELVRQTHAEQRAAMRVLVSEEPPQDLAQALDQLVEIAMRHSDSPTAALLIGEMQLQARRDPEFARRVSAGFEEQTMLIAGWIDNLLAPEARHAALPSRELARIVTALTQGFAQQPIDRAAVKGMLRQALGRLFSEG